MKTCPKCGSDSVVKYSSLNYCQCAVCGETFDWTREEGQTPVVPNNRQTRKNNNG